MKMPFDEKYKIDGTLDWGTLKYGLCSYFAMAYAEKYKSKRFLAILEDDEEMGKKYLVHFLVILENGDFLDAEKSYTSWKESVEEMTDIEYMDLVTEMVNISYIKKAIDHDLGYDESLYRMIQRFVNEVY